MGTARKWLLALVSLIAWGVFLAACTSAPQLIAIPPIKEVVKPPSYGSKDYPGALTAIMSIMVHDLKLPGVEGVVTVYSSQASYESGVVAESEIDLERLRKQLGPTANRLNEEELILAARRSAVSSVAVGMYKKVLVNDWRISRYSWPDWIRVLAHELTHTVQRELVDGRLTSSDQWLREGFAEWVGCQVVHTFGAEEFAASRKRALEGLANASYYQTFPSLTQLATNSQWLTWSRTLGRAATYDQALIAVDWLIEQKGLAAVVQYFSLFGKLNNRQRNFRSAFGEPIAGFDEKFGKHLQVLLGRTDRIAALH